MNANLSYLRWLKQNHPQVLKAAITKVQRKSALGGLGDDLTSDISFDPSTVSVSDDISSAIDTATTNPTSAPATSTDWSGIIGAVAAAAPAVATSVVQTQAQLATIQVNAQRAAAGLPPLGSTSLLTGQGLAANSGTLLLLLGVGAVALLAGKGGHSSEL
jgi:hypothetical protein